MTTLRWVLVLALSGCVVSTGRSRSEPVAPLAQCLSTCSGCCDDEGLCRAGSSVSACGTRGTVCAACTGGEVCRLNQCQAPAPQVVARAPEPGDLTFRWRFGGQACAVVREVTTVALDVPGLVLPNGGLFPCATGAADGVTLSAVPPGLYRFSARGLTAGGALLYEASGFVSVDGPVLKRVELEPAAGSVGRALVSWRLPGASTCVAVGAPGVVVSVEGRPVSASAGCEQGAVELTHLPAGVQTISVVALDAQGAVRAAARGPLHVVPGATVAAEFTLAWQVGGLAVRWGLNRGGRLSSCAQAGVTEVFLNLRAADGTFLSPGAGTAVPCEAGAALFTGLPPGRFELFGQAVGAFGALFRAAPVVVDVQPGVFPQVTDQSPTLWL